MRAVAGSFGFSAENADKKIEKLSGGEKARLTMGLATFDAPHLLILDEPTNHLDIDSRAALIEAINDFLAPPFWSRTTAICSTPAPIGCGSWQTARSTTFDGDLDDYRRQVSPGPRDDSRDERPRKARVQVRPRPAKRLGVSTRSRCASASPAPRPEIARLTKELEKFDAALADGASSAAIRSSAAGHREIARACADALARPDAVAAPLGRSGRVAGAFSGESLPRT